MGGTRTGWRQGCWRVGSALGLWGWEAPEARREGQRRAEPRTQPLPGGSGAEPCSASRALCKLGSAVDKREGAVSYSCRILGIIDPRPG